MASDYEDRRGDSPYRQSEGSQYFNGPSYDQRPVSDRLITMGKLYEAKKQRLREQVEYRRKSEEEQSLLKVTRKGKKQPVGAGQEKVEERLMEQKKKYD